MPSAADAVALSYVLPLRTEPAEDVTELAGYVRWLAEQVDDVIVVDGSSPADVAAHRRAFGPAVRTVEPRLRTPNGKVGNVLTGVELARHEEVVLADDDVRYTVEQLGDVRGRLAGATVVRPQNHFSPLVWHARIDTARTLLARATGGDWPGTLACRRSALLDAGGYAGDVLFENLQLVRTLRAAGGTEHVALDLVVRRLPPTTAHFRGQQVRQAYDEFARPLRLLVFLAVAPLAAACVRGGRRRVLATAAVAVAALAEGGRRRGGGRPHFPATSALIAPAWVLWRSVCSWVALGAYLRGGVRYRGRRLRRAATPMWRLRRELLT